MKGSQVMKCVRTQLSRAGHSAKSNKSCFRAFFLNSLFSTWAREVSSVCLTCEMGTDVEV